MTNPPTLTEKIKSDIVSRAALGEEITTAIFDSIVDADIDWRNVHADDVKPVLIEAIRASNRANRQIHAAMFSTSNLRKLSLPISTDGYLSCESEYCE